MMVVLNDVRAVERNHSPGKPARDGIESAKRLLDRYLPPYRSFQRLRERKRAAEIVRRGWGYAPLHGDAVLRELVDEIVEEFDISFFVETGTFVGDTAKHVALKHPKLTVLTCEINPIWLGVAKRFCAGIENIQFFEETSPLFLKRVYGLLRQSVPLFWLDAHWEDYWPLFEETKIISALPKYTIIIDDFQVPNRPEFHYDYQGRIKNSISTHKEVLGGKCFVPDYESPTGGLVGYGVFFKGLGYSRLSTLTKLRELSALP